MDWVVQKKGLLEKWKKYRFVLLAALMGVFLMSVPEEKESQPKVAVEEIVRKQDLEQSLSDILSQVAGAGKVEVLLTQQAGESILYQNDEDITGDSVRRDTVLITGADRTESGLIRQILPPVYRGAVILCQGADNAQVRLSIAQAIKSATGLSLDRITILKMK